jgi:hypothetical protein
VAYCIITVIGRRKVEISTLPDCILCSRLLTDKEGGFSFYLSSSFITLLPFQVLLIVLLFLGLEQLTRTRNSEPVGSIFSKSPESEMNLIPCYAFSFCFSGCLAFYC